MTGGSLWGTLLSQEVSFTVIPGSTVRFLQGAGQQNEREAKPGGPRRALRVTAKKTLLCLG